MKLRVYPAIRCFHKISDFLTIPSVAGKRFEEEFCKWSGGKKILYTYRARTGLFHLLSYLKGKFGINRIIVPSYTCKEVIHPIKKVGLEIVFVDNDMKTLGIDSSNVNIKKNDVVLWVNYFGLKSRPSKKIIDGDAFIIEDNASHFLPPSEYADFTLYSLGKGKEFSSSEGGIVTINNKEFDDFIDVIKLREPDFFNNAYRFFDYLFWRITTIRTLYTLARKIRKLLVRDEHHEFNFNPDIEGVDFSLSPISKKLGYKQLLRMKDFQTKSKILCTGFVNRLQNIKYIRVLTSDESNYFSVNFLADRRNGLKKFLESNGVFGSMPWNYLIGTILTGKKFKNSSKILASIMQIKIDPTFMENDDIQYITDKIKEFYKSV